ncbi:MAG: hypothetical protein K9K67_13100 [Bacteriovoracaceae bacterium]|nr:hypothetical protein [Bacteriovoracaceae bacterium]
MLKRFNVLNNENDQSLEGIDYSILLNLEQIVSVKTINIMYRGNIIKGFWIRMVNGKKYKATRVPNEINMLLGDENDLTDVEINGATFNGESSEMDISLQ